MDCLKELREEWLYPLVRGGVLGKDGWVRIIENCKYVKSGDITRLLQHGNQGEMERGVVWGGKTHSLCGSLLLRVSLPPLMALDSFISSSSPTSS